MTKFLTFKHWQLFIVLMGLPIILQIIAISSFILSGNPAVVFYFSPLIMLVFFGLFFSWFYVLGTNLYKKLPKTANMNLTRFKIFLLIPVIYVLLYSVFVSGMFFKIASGGEPNPYILGFIIPFHLFSMFCIFYCLYFNAKALKTVECQKEVSFSDFVGEFLLIWFFPIGVWILQPRINKLFNGNIEKELNQILTSNTH